MEGYKKPAPGRENPPKTLSQGEAYERFREAMGSVKAGGLYAELAKARQHVEQSIKEEKRQGRYKSEKLLKALQKEEKRLIDLKKGIDHMLSSTVPGTSWGAPSFNVPRITTKEGGRTIMEHLEKFVLGERPDANPVTTRERTPQELDELIAGLKAQAVFNDPATLADKDLIRVERPSRVWDTRKEGRIIQVGPEIEEEPEQPESQEETPTIDIEAPEMDPLEEEDAFDAMVERIAQGSMMYSNTLHHKNERKSFFKHMDKRARMEFPEARAIVLELGDKYVSGGKVTDDQLILAMMDYYRAKHADKADTDFGREVIYQSVLIAVDGARKDRRQTLKEKKEEQAAKKQPAASTKEKKPKKKRTGLVTTALLGIAMGGGGIYAAGKYGPGMFEPLSIGRNVDEEKGASPPGLDNPTNVGDTLPADEDYAPAERVPLRDLTEEGEQLRTSGANSRTRSNKEQTGSPVDRQLTDLSYDQLIDQQDNNRRPYQ